MQTVLNDVTGPSTLTVGEGPCSSVWSYRLAAPPSQEFVRNADSLVYPGPIKSEHRL